MKAHWAVKYIGLPYANGARGPDVFDCWGLVWWVQKHEFGRILPEFPVLECAPEIKAQLKEWSQVETPSDGDVVVMNGGRHVGIYMDADAGLVLHARGGFGPFKATIGAQSLDVLKKLYCCRGLEFYHFNG